MTQKFSIYRALVREDNGAASEILKYCEFETESIARVWLIAAVEEHGRDNVEGVMTELIWSHVKDNWKHTRTGTLTADNRIDWRYIR